MLHTLSVVVRKKERKVVLKKTKVWYRPKTHHVYAGAEYEESAKVGYQKVAHGFWV